jgi:amino acid transporter
MTEDRSAQARFGTFGGVFTPCVLTILGVIMFMRSGYVVGDTGIWRALIILAIAKSITTLTTMSLSAIATNTEVRTGGVYYMISRTLGPDFGGAIGLTLFVSQAISVAFYVIGFSEALFGLFPADTYAAAQEYKLEQICSSVMIVALFFVTFKGADLAIRAQYFILGVLLLSVVSFVIGGLTAFDSGNFSDNMGSHDSSVGFWVVFAIFFPAATGITAGANMSGDLKDPGEAIPRGTMAAIGFTAIVYVIQLILLAGFTSNDSLVNDPFGAIQRMSLWGPLIVAGVFAATLSSALGSFLGAPRILQAMGKDRLLKPLVYFGTGYGPADEPRRATVLTLVIAVAIVWAGGLNAIAAVISMFFLIAYGMINLSAFVEGRGGNPSFRPRFKVFGWPAALAGTIGCAIAMFKINETYALISMVIAAGIYLWLRGRTSGDWGDAKRGYIFSRTRENLLMLENMSTDPKNWRPVLAVITEDAERDVQLIQCASWIESGRGLLSVLELSTGPGGEAGPETSPHRTPPPGFDEENLPARLDHRSRRVDHIQRFLQGRSVIAFADSVVVSDVADRLDVILQAYSIGSLRPNTLMVSVPPPAQVERRKRVSDMLKTVSSFGLNLVVYKGARVDNTAVKKRIDVWWHGRRNGSLLALFAYLANSHDDWGKARIRMLRVVSSGAEHLEAEQSLKRMMAAARLAVDVEVVLSQKPVSELIPERSGSADLVLMGLADATLKDFQAFLERTDALLARLPPTLLVLSNGEADLLA